VARATVVVMPVQERLRDFYFNGACRTRCHSLFSPLFTSSLFWRRSAHGAGPFPLVPFSRRSPPPSTSPLSSFYLLILFPSMALCSTIPPPSFDFTHIRVEPAPNIVNPALRSSRQGFPLAWFPAGSTPPLPQRAPTTVMPVPCPISRL